MEPVFSEKMRVIPEKVEYATMAILIPTLAFILVSIILDWTDWWLFAVFAVITVFLFIMFRVFILKTDVYEDEIVIKYIRTRKYRIGKVLDRRNGLMNDLRNYSGIGLRGFKYRYYTSTGCDTGVLFRTPNTVVAVSSVRHEELASLLPKAVMKEEQENE